jgi:small subunit ribosomal protein S17
MILQTRRKPKEELGRVISASMNKTVVVEIIRKIRHPKYGKVINQRKKYYAHDESDVVTVDSFVRIVESRPLSKLKRWRVTEVVKNSQNDANVLVKE